MKQNQGKTATRREFVIGAGLLGAAGVLGAAGCSAPAPEPAAAPELSDASDETTSAAPEPAPVQAQAEGGTVINRIDNASDDLTYIPHPNEYPTVPMPAPETTAYECDVLVVGGGLAGLNAAYAAFQHETGCEDCE